MAQVFKDEPEIEYIAGHPYPKVSPKRIHAVVQLAVAMVLQRVRGAAASSVRSGDSNSGRAPSLCLTLPTFRTTAFAR